MKTYIVLLRGINVSGKNKLPMADLRELLSKLNFQNVQTYIQSGNIIFGSELNSTKENNQILQETISKIKIENKLHLEIVNHSKEKMIKQNDEYKMDERRKREIIDESGKLYGMVNRISMDEEDTMSESGDEAMCVMEKDDSYLTWEADKIEAFNNMLSMSFSLSGYLNIGDVYDF